MMIWFSFLSLVILSTAQLAVGSIVRRQNGGSNLVGSPCAVVSASASAAILASPSARPTVDAQLAYDCLTSVPLIPADATALVTSILPYVEWQSGKMDPILQ